MRKKRISAKKVWGYWTNKLLNSSIDHYGDYVPDAALCIAIIVSAGEDKDLTWLDSDGFKSCCSGAGLDPISVKDCIQYSVEYLEGKRGANFQLNEIGA